MLKDLINKILDEVGLESLFSDKEDHNMEEDLYNNDGFKTEKNKNTH